MKKNGFDEDFNFRVPPEGAVKKYLDWYMYYEIGAEEHVSEPSCIKELKDLDLVGYDFSNKDLCDIQFNNCNLSSCKFTNSNLYNASFVDCIICYADFSDAVIESASFINCKLLGSSFEGCSSYNVWFDTSVGYNLAGTVKERDLRAVAVICEPLYRHNDCQSEMRMINRNNLPLPDFSYFETIDSVDYPYRTFMTSWLGSKLIYLESILLGCKSMFRNHFYDKKTGRVTGIDFTGVDLSNYDLSDISFYKCKFIETKFPAGFLYNTVFEDCTIEACDFSEVFFKDVSFKGCLLFNPKIKQAQLKDFKQSASLYYDIEFAD